MKNHQNNFKVWMATSIQKLISLVKEIKTNIELQVVLGIITLLASIIVPIGINTYNRTKPTDLERIIVDFVDSYTQTTIPQVPDSLKEMPDIKKTYDNLKKIDYVCVEMQDLNAELKNIGDCDLLTVKTILQKMVRIDRLGQQALYDEYFNHLIGISRGVISDSITLSETDINVLLTHVTKEEVSTFKNLMNAANDVLKQTICELNQEGVGDKAKLKIVRRMIHAPEIIQFNKEFCNLLISCKKYYIEYLQIRMYPTNDKKRETHLERRKGM